MMTVDKAPETHEDRAKTLANYAIIILGLVAVGAIIKVASHVFIPITVAYFCMLLLSPVVTRTAKVVDAFLFRTKKKFGREHKSEESQLVTAFTLIFILLGFAILLFGFFLLVQGQIKMILNQSDEIMTNVVTPVKDWLQSVGILGNAADIDIKVDELKDTALKIIPSAAIPIISVLFTFVFIVFLTIFLMLGKSRIDTKLENEYQGKTMRFNDISSSIGTHIRKYLLTKLATSFITGVSITLLLLIWLKPQFALIWGLVYFIMNFIPIYGSMVAGFFTVLYTLAASSSAPIPPYFSVLFIVLINILVSNALEPKLMQFQLPIGSVNVLVAVIIWGFLWGAWGMFLAVPITICFKILIESIYGKTWFTIFLEA